MSGHNYDHWSYSGTVPRRNETIYQFGDESYEGLVKLSLMITITNYYSVNIQSSVVNLYFTLLLGLRVLERVKLIFYYRDYTITSTAEELTIPLSKRYRHAYIY